MRRSFLLLLCLCISAGILVLYLFRPVAKLSVPSTGAIKPVLQPIAINTFSDASTNILTNSVATVPFQTQQDSNTVAGIQPAVTNVADDVPDETAKNEQSELLRKLREWAAKDPEAALAAVMKLPEGDERNQALGAVCLGVAQTDPAVAVQMAQTLNLDKQPGALMQNLVQQWASTDLSSALDWVNSQPVGGQRNDLTERIAFVLSQTQPADAADLVLTQIPAGSAQDQAVMTVLLQWENQDLAGATAWANGFPDGLLREGALNELKDTRLHRQLLADQ